MTSTTVTMRRAREADLYGIAAIYNEAVQDRIATCDLSDVPRDRLGAWLSGLTPPWGVWVCHDPTDGILGWVSVSPYDTKPCFHRTATFATYVARRARGRGVGTLLREHMIAIGREAGFHSMVNRVWANNTASIALAEKFGFQQVGHVREIVDLDGALVDCLFFQLVLD